MGIGDGTFEVKIQLGKGVQRSLAIKLSDVSDLQIAKCDLVPLCIVSLIDTSCHSCDCRHSCIDRSFSVTTCHFLTLNPLSLGDDRFVE